MTKHTTFGHTDQFGRSLTVRVLSHYWQWVLLTIWCSSRMRGGSVSIGPRDHLFRATTVETLFIVIVFICISRLSTRLTYPQRYRVLAIGDRPRPRGQGRRVDATTAPVAVVAPGVTIFRTTATFQLDSIATFQRDRLGSRLLMQQSGPGTHLCRQHLVHMGAHTSSFLFCLALATRTDASRRTRRISRFGCAHVFSGLACGRSSQCG